MGKRLTYPEGKGREFMLRVTGGEDAYYSAYSSPNRWHFNPQGPFKWRVNSAGWVYVAKPAVLKVLGEKRFGWREYRVEKDGMIKQVGFKDFTTKEEAEKAFLSLNSQFNVGDKVYVDWFSGDQDYATVVKYNPSNDTYDVRLESGEIAHPKAKLLISANAIRSTNSIVAKAMNAVAQNGYVKLYAKAGGTATVYEGDKVEYDGKVYTAKALGSPSMDSATLVDDAGNKLVVKMKDYKLKALNEDTSVVTEKAVNTRWRIIYKNLNGPLFPYGKETYSTKEEAEKRAEELRKQGKKWGSNNSYFVDVVNAKFKRGDKVVWTAFGGKPMEVIDMNDKGEYLCRDKDGNEVVFSEEKLKLANAARSRNSKWVILYRDGGKEKIEAPSHAEAKKIAEAKSKKSGRGYTSVIVDDGVDYDRWQFFNAKACNSTNAIVRKAMNATKARNAKVGDTVWWYDEEDRRVYKGFKIDKILSSGLVEISKKGEGSFTVKRSELALPGGMAITWTNSTARNAEDDFLQYYADSYSYIPKVGEIYKYDGKRVKCTSVQKLQRGNDDRDRFLVEGRVVG